MRYKRIQYATTGSKCSRCKTDVKPGTRMFLHYKPNKKIFYVQLDVENKKQNYTTELVCETCSKELHIYTPPKQCYTRGVRR